MKFPSSFSFNNLDGRNGFLIEAPDGENAGASVDILGDINGDGIDDFIVGAPAAAPNGELSGKSYVVFGSNEVATVKLNELNGQNGFVLNGIATVDGVSGEFLPGDRAGGLVSRAGDVNGDGIDDILVAANKERPRSLDGGGAEVFVIFGRQSGFEASTNIGSTLDGNNGFSIVLSDGLDDISLESISAAGDINGDGFGDIIIGAPLVEGELDKSYVVFGSREPSSIFNLANLDGSNGFVVTEAETSFSETFGRSVSAAGDINHDGIDDLIIGNPGVGQTAETNRQSGNGESYVIFGTTSGFDASLSTSELDGSNGFVINASQPFSALGSSVSSAGDFNGDGIDDLIIGAPGANLTVSVGSRGFFDSFAGESYVLFGREDGFSDTVDLANLDSSSGFTIKGNSGDPSLGILELNNRLGTVVSVAGDINSDGFDDVFVGGRFGSYVVFGREEGGEVTVQLDGLSDRNGFKLPGFYEAIAIKKSRHR